MIIVEIKGAIVSNDDQYIYDWLDIEATSPKKVQEKINKANGVGIEVIINSPGGNVFSASEIYTMLRSYKDNVTVKIVGIAASAASVIAMAGKTVLMSPTSQLMMHNVSVRAAGDYRDMEHTAEVLKNANDTIANAYIFKSNMSREKLLAMMDKETWLTPAQALGYGLIDRIMFDDTHTEKEKAQASLELLKIK